MHHKTQPISQVSCTESGIDPLLNVRECAALLKISVPTFWRRVADGTVTKPLKLGALSRWPQSEILEVIENAKAHRGTA